MPVFHDIKETLYNQCKNYFKNMRVEEPVPGTLNMRWEYTLDCTECLFITGLCENTYI